MNAGRDGHRFRGTKLTNNDVQPSTEKRDWAVVAFPFVPADVRRSGIETFVLVLRRQPVLVLLLETRLDTRTDTLMPNSRTAIDAQGTGCAVNRVRVPLR